jgi:hypothetical protein
MRILSLIVLLLGVIFVTSLQSQPFTFTRITPETVMGDSSDFEIVGYAKLNPNSGSLAIRLIRTIEDLTPSWDSLGTAICNINGCYPPSVDTIEHTYSSSNADDTISIHFYCMSVYTSTFLEGAGHVRIRAELVTNPSQFINLDFEHNTCIYRHKANQLNSKDFSLNQNYPNLSIPVPK